MSVYAGMDIKDIMMVLPKMRRDEFVRFVEYGDCTQEFLDYLDKDPVAQAAVDTVFKAQVKQFEEFFRWISAIDNSCY